MFTKITNPENGKKVSIFSKQGKDILKKYTKITKLQGGALSRATRASRAIPASRTTIRSISDNNTAHNAAFNEQQRLNIITLQNQHYQMNYNLGTTINNFRQAISNLTNIPLNVLGIIHAGRMINNQQALDNADFILPYDDIYVFTIQQPQNAINPPQQELQAPLQQDGGNNG